VIDTRPPQIDILSRAHNIAQGGAGLVIYRTSEFCPESGVRVGKNFFPGYPGFFQDSNVSMAFFALEHSQGKGTEIFVQAADHADNKTRAGFPHYIKQKVFKKDVITISDAFLNWKIPEFNMDIRQDTKTSNVEKFLKINRELRRLNYQKINEIGAVSANIKYWEGAFLRLPNAARMAGFADHRTYKYKGRIIDRQIHLGVDLASVERAAVPASNGGKVVFADQLGIYGKTVIIDHGFGLFSMYSHLSNLNVKKEQIISKGDQIGYTGRTGLAGGDHLHFAMLIHHTFVNPIEWWDTAWIENNISGKMVAVKTGLGE
jgi:murein DD-endopeptidase MepM/ murein hydrolase activator NlpD